MRYIKRLARVTAGKVLTNQPKYVVVDTQTGISVAHCIGDRRTNLVLAALNTVEELEQKVCDSCLEYEDDGTPYTAYGWNENAVEGQIPCACISESGPYQILVLELEAIEALPYTNSQTLLAPAMAGKALRRFGHESKG